MARHKNYICTCLECGKSFTATRNDAKFDTGACKAKWSREHRKDLIKSQAVAIKVQNKVISKITQDPDWLDRILSKIVFPSISRYKTGTLTGAEIKELERTARVLGKTKDEYMRELEASVPIMHPDIAKLFE